jgi:type 2 lantibiotic biosynthesis protein LanM
MNLPTSNTNNDMNQTKDLFLGLADFIGARLCRDALWAGSRCNWLGASMEFVGNTWAVVHRAFGPELYNGTAGIALFLARLFEATNEKPYRTTAEGGIRQALTRLEDINLTARAGFYTGLIGIAYTSLQLGETFGKQEFIDKGLQLAETLVKDNPDRQALDVLAGSAGCIPALLNIHQRYQKDYLIDLAIRHGEHLLETARKSENGWSWNTLEDFSEHDLTGFSHGAAGIAWALLELFQVTQQEKFCTGAEQGFLYERYWFSPQHGNWPDFRSFSTSTAGSEGTPTYMVAWCHGAPGIGLSRLRAYQLLGKEAYRHEAEAALQTTVQALQQAVLTNQGNYSLCHGNAGNAELLIYASRVLDNTDYKAIADQVGKHGIEQYQKNTIPWPCGVIGGGETPNLMLGLAGIGYFYLRLYDPMKYPPVVIILPNEDQL